MPFINDRMEDGRRRRGDARALAVENVLDDQIQVRHRQISAVGRFQFDLPMIEAHLRRQIIGQDEAVNLVVDLLGMVLADIGDGRRPLGTVLFLGPTGVGKTELVRSVAQGLHGDADSICRIDMNTLGQEHYAAAISGAPPGYVGSKEGHTLFDQEKIEGSLHCPGIVLFDEIEKASPQVAMALLNIFDNGTLTVASGERTYSFRNSIIFMTSNLASHQLRRELMAMHSGWRRRLFPLSVQLQRQRLYDVANAALIERFTPEFVGRLDFIEVFNAIQPADVLFLVSREVDKLNARLAKHQCSLTLTNALSEHLGELGFDLHFGARSLRRIFRRMVEVPLAQLLNGRSMQNESCDNWSTPQSPSQIIGDLVHGKVSLQIHEANSTQSGAENHG